MDRKVAIASSVAAGRNARLTGDHAVRKDGVAMKRFGVSDVYVYYNHGSWLFGKGENGNQVLACRAGSGGCVGQYRATPVRAG
jgi:hypothetical protein